MAAIENSAMSMNVEIETTNVAEQPLLEPLEIPKEFIKTISAPHPGASSADTLENIPRNTSNANTVPLVANESQLTLPRFEQLQQLQFEQHAIPMQLLHQLPQQQTQGQLMSHHYLKQAQGVNPVQPAGLSAQHIVQPHISQLSPLPLPVPQQQLNAQLTKQIQLQQQYLLHPSSRNEAQVCTRDVWYAD